MRTEYPSWGYMLKNGATTVWERWNGYTRENGFEGLVRPDHTPTLAGEANDNPGYEMLGNLFAFGYIRGIADTLNLV